MLDNPNLKKARIYDDETLENMKNSMELMIIEVY